MTKRESTKREPTAGGALVELLLVTLIVGLIAATVLAGFIERQKELKDQQTLPGGLSLEETLGQLS